MRRIRLKMVVVCQLARVWNGERCDRLDMRGQMIGTAQRCGLWDAGDEHRDHGGLEPSLVLDKTHRTLTQETFNIEAQHIKMPYVDTLTEQLSRVSRKSDCYETAIKVIG